MTPIEKALKTLREVCPNGHPEFVNMLVNAAELHSRKAHDYASKGSPLGNFDRLASILMNYPNLPLHDPVVVIMLQMLKQVDAVMWLLNSNIDAQVEGPMERLKDIHVFAGLAICALQDKPKVTFEFGHECICEDA
jgi:hypothetical protein